jgi:hypothetical protein
MFAGTCGKEMRSLVTCLTVMGRSAALVTMVLVPLVTACANSRETPTSEDQLGRSIECSSRDTTWDFCLRKARDLCGKKGYEVLEKAVYYSGSRYISRNMIVDCKN